MTTYEQYLDSNVRAALEEGSLHFDSKSRVHLALQKITRRLNELGIPYAVVGGMALYIQGFRRFTEDVDLLVTQDGLNDIHKHLDGLGYVPPFAGSKHLRDTEHGVKIEFLVTGQFPGDGKPKPVAFPDPIQSSVEVEGLRVLAVPSILELKLASGMTNAGRLKDLADVQELIRILRLPRSSGEQLNPFVRDRFFELWDAVESDQTSHDQT